MPKIDVFEWTEHAVRLKNIYSGPTAREIGVRQGINLVNSWIYEKTNEPATNRDWLNSLSPVELVDWIKNTASAMSDAELLKWLEEKRNG